MLRVVARDRGPVRVHAVDGYTIEGTVDAVLEDHLQAGGAPPRRAAACCRRPVGGGRAARCSGPAAARRPVEPRLSGHSVAAPASAPNGCASTNSRVWAYMRSMYSSRRFCSTRHCPRPPTLIAGRLARAHQRVGLGRRDAEQAPTRR
nr:hypothetical protein [Angustibacter aerolatus]